MAFVESYGMTCHQSAHDLAERRGPCSEKQMEMVWNQCPSIALGLRLFKDQSKAIQKGPTVSIVRENLSSFYSPGHHMLKKA
jgi:hypothetical protein